MQAFVSLDHHPHRLRDLELRLPRLLTRPLQERADARARALLDLLEDSRRTTPVTLLPSKKLIR
jgi:hypothetical protein